MSPRAPSVTEVNPHREPPSTARGARTRAKLVTAARTVFERDGYLAARLTDITAEAGCSIGTFYTYFDSKEQIFAAVLEAAQSDMMHPGLPHVAPEDSCPRTIVAASHRAYLTAYARNAKLMRLLDQVASADPKFAQVRRARAVAFAERNARAIAELQRQGVADPSLDPELTSACLSTMVSRIAFHAFVLGENWSIDELVDTLTTLWINALHITTTQGDAHE